MPLNPIFLKIYSLFNNLDIIIGKAIMDPYIHSKSPNPRNDIKRDHVHTKFSSRRSVHVGLTCHMQLNALGHNVLFFHGADWTSHVRRRRMTLYSIRNVAFSEARRLGLSSHIRVHAQTPMVGRVGAKNLST